MTLYPQWWRTNFLWVEFALAFFIGITFGWWVVFRGGAATVEPILDGNRGPVYGAIATIWGSLLGFVITAISVVLGLVNHERLTVVRESKHYAQLWHVFTAASKALAFATLGALAALIIDRDTHVNYYCLAICVWLSVLCIFRLGRCMWVLERIIEILIVPK
jgi:hypothetical protein